jgi:hypothetical protein
MPALGAYTLISTEVIAQDHTLTCTALPVLKPAAGVHLMNTALKTDGVYAPATGIARFAGHSFTQPATGPIPEWHSANAYSFITTGATNARNCCRI